MDYRIFNMHMWSFCMSIRKGDLRRIFCSLHRIWLWRNFSERVKAEHITVAHPSGDHAPSSLTLAFETEYSCSAPDSPSTFNTTTNMLQCLFERELCSVFRKREKVWRKKKQPSHTGKNGQTPPPLREHLRFWQNRSDTLSRITFQHLPPNSASGYATEGALFISTQLSTDMGPPKGLGTNKTVKAT